MSDDRQALTRFAWSSRCEWQVMSLSKDLSWSDLRDAKFLIAVSLRNPKFSNHWLKAVVEDALELGGTVKVCLVDTPYFERVKYSSQERVQQLQKLTSLFNESVQQEQRLTKVLSVYAARVEVFRWVDVERSVPTELFDELRSAFGQRQRVYAALSQQVRLSTRLETAEEVEEASIFLLREFPVLAFMYYALFPNTIDVYPGPQSDFFWELESHTYAEEMPLMTRLAAEAPASVYAHATEHADVLA
jgi:hypothetical protein